MKLLCVRSSLKKLLRTQGKAMCHGGESFTAPDPFPSKAARKDPLDCRNKRRASCEEDPVDLSRVDGGLRQQAIDCLGNQCKLLSDPALKLPARARNAE